MPHLDKKRDNKAVNFSNAFIQIKKRENAEKMAVTNITSDNVAYGLPNNLQFKLPALEYNQIYDVTITDVVVDGVKRDYQYWFKITS